MKNVIRFFKNLILRIRHRKYVRELPELAAVIPEPHRNLIVLDTETTGLDCKKDDLLQVSIVDGDGELIFNEYVRPLRKLSWPGAQRVNGISPEMVAGCPPVTAYLSSLQAILDSADRIGGYNTSFDLDFLKAAGLRIGSQEVIDVMEEFAPIYGEYSEKYGKYKWQKLTRCAEYYGYDWGSGRAHDSLADARATLFCLKKIRNAV